MKTFPHAYPGARYRNDNWPGEYIVALVARDLVALVSMEDGNRWTDAVEVKDAHNITEDEWTKLTDGKAIRFVQTNHENSAS